MLFRRNASVVRTARWDGEKTTTIVYGADGITDREAHSWPAWPKANFKRTERRMTPREQVIEAMARAIYEGGGTSDPDLLALAEGIAVDHATAALDAMLAALPGIGLRVVPAEMTEKMAVAYSLAPVGRCDDGTFGWGQSWIAAVAAAPDVLEAKP